MVARFFAVFALGMFVGAGFAQQLPPITPGPVPSPEQTSLTTEQMLQQVRERKERALANRGNPQSETLLRENLQALAALLQREPGNIEGNLLTGEIAIELSDYDRARTAFKEVLRNEPGNYRANLGTGKIYISNRYWRQAISFLESAEKVAPEASRAEVKRLLAIANAGAANLEQAIRKADEAVQANPSDLDALQTRVLVRIESAKLNPDQMTAAIKDAEAYLKQAVEGVRQKPWDRPTLSRLNAAYQTMVGPPSSPGVLQVYHNSLYEVTRDQVSDRLRSGKGPEAAAALVRIAETLRQQSMLALVLQEHDALALAERAVAEEYAPTNVTYLEHLLATYQQLQDLTARLVGPEVARDATLRDRAVATCRKILALDPQNEPAGTYLQSVGVSAAVDRPVTP